MNKAILIEYGVDFDKGLARCTNDAEFFETLLSMFLQDDSFMRAKAAYEAQDAQELFRCMHELKGVSGTAALTKLYEVTCPLVELLRSGAAEQADIDRLFAPVEMAYYRICEGISLAIAR